MDYSEPGLSDFDSETDPMFGIGAKFQVNDKMGITLSYSRFDFGGDNIDSVNLGVNFNLNK